MDILRFALYVLAPWVPFLLHKWLYNFKVWAILLFSVLLMLPFIGPYLLGYSFSIHAIFTIVFILFLIGFSTIAWLLTNKLRFIFFVSLVNIPTILLFYFINWNSTPYNREKDKPESRELNVESTYYSGIQESYEFGNLKAYYAYKKYLGGLLIKEYRLDLINYSDTCLYKGFDYDRNNEIYWDKCKNKIN